MEAPREISKKQTLPTLILTLNLQSVKRRLLDKEEGLGWELELCKIAETEYRRYLTLVLENPNVPIVPNKLIDEFWHLHVLDTDQYLKDSTRIFGGFLHHNPNFGRGSAIKKKRLTRAFERTKQLYQIRFKEPMDRVHPVLSQSASTCGSVCVSSCRSAIT